MSIKVEKITEPVLLGEGPHWDDRQQALFFVSIMEHTINKYVPATGEHTTTKIEDGSASFIVPVEGSLDQFVVGVGRKFLIIQWDGKDGSPAKIVKVLAEVHKDTRKTKINDGKADPRGRLYAGTLGYDEELSKFETNKGSLFRLDGAEITTLDDNISLSNGLAWDLKEKAFYYTDSFEFKIRRYDYDVETGNISNMKHIFDLKENNLDGLADGTTIDTDGNLWVACFNGSCVIKIDPRTGKLLQKVPIPARQVTSVTFGGENLDILFVTTGSFAFEGKEATPGCGFTYKVTGLGVKGYPNVNYKL